MIIEPMESQRLCLRPFQDEDWQSVYEYMADATVTAYLPGGLMTALQSREFVQKNQLAETATAYPLILKATDKQIGHMIFHSWYAPRTYEIGWVLHPDYHRQGYATEAALALLYYGFDNLMCHRIIATCQPENIGSFRVMEKIGMRREGHFRQCIYRGEEQWWDEYFYAILAEEWRARRT